MTKLVVTSAPSAMSIVVRNASLSVVGQGSSPLELQVDPGVYMATAIRDSAADDINEVVVIARNDERTVHLTADDPSLVQRTLNRVQQIVSGPSSTHDPRILDPLADNTVEPATSFRIRFLRLKSWSESESVELPIAGYRYARGEANVDIAIAATGTLFAQVESDFAGRLNVELPPAGPLATTRCRLVVIPTERSIKAYVKLSADELDAAGRYLSRGYVTAAQDELAKIEPSKTNQVGNSSFFSNAFNFFRSRSADPAKMLLERYVQLRAGDQDYIEDTFHQFPDSLHSLPDSYIISAERSARNGNHKEALRLLLQIENGNLPLFTEGFSLLITRLRQYSQQRFASQEIDDTEAEKARKLLDQLYTWAPVVDLKCLTLTFPGADPAKPTEQEAPDQVRSERWQSIIPNSVFASNPPPLIGRFV